MTKIYGNDGQPVADADAMAAVAATATTQDAIDVLIERLNYWRSKAIAEAGEIEAMEQAYAELQQQFDYMQNSRDMFMSSAKAWRATAERNASACAHWQSVALERKGERDSARTVASFYGRSRERYMGASEELALRVTELEEERDTLKAANAELYANVERLHNAANQQGTRIIEQTVLGYSFFVDNFGNEYILRTEHRRVLNELRAANERAQGLVNQIEREEAQTREDHQKMTTEIEELRARCLAIANERDAALQQIETLRNTHAQELAAKQHALQVLQSALRSAEAECEMLQQAIETMKQTATPLAPQALIDAEDLKLLVALRDAISRLVERAEEPSHE